MLRKPSNFIILDEPTNDLDLMTLRVLEESLSEYPGCAIVITHDRYFLDRVATHILGFEGDAEVEFCSGTWDFYIEQREKRLGREGRREVAEVQAPEDRPIGRIAKQGESTPNVAADCMSQTAG